MNRDEIVVLTKVCTCTSFDLMDELTRTCIQVYGAVGRNKSEVLWAGGPEADSRGYVNQYGLSRKVLYRSEFRLEAK